MLLLHEHAQAVSVHRVTAPQHLRAESILVSEWHDAVVKTQDGERTMLDREETNAALGSRGEEVFLADGAVLVHAVLDATVIVVQLHRIAASADLAVKEVLSPADSAHSME